GLGQLRLAELDLINDICYQAPLSAIDYTWLTMKFMKIFDAVEERLIEPSFCSVALQGNNGRCVLSDEPAAPVRGQYASIILRHFIDLHLDDRYPGYLIVSQIPTPVNKHKHKHRINLPSPWAQKVLSMARDLNGSLRVPYLNYKKDTRYILWWLAHASNSIIAAIPDVQRVATDVINTTGHMTCAEIKIMSRRVGTAFLKRGEQVPSTILYLFDSVIKARQEMSEEYKTMFTGTQDEEFERSNDRHQAFIDTLTFAFKALGGDQWLLIGAEKQHESLGSEKEIEEVVFANAFSALSVQQTDDHFDISTDSCTDEAPLKEHCVEDGPDETLDHTLVICMAFLESVILRRNLQTLWQNVVYGHLNIAVVAVESNMAIALVKTTAAAVFVESDSKCESNDSYINLLGQISNAALTTVTDCQHPEFREACGIHIYNSLVDFVLDYRKNRTGRPTKRLQMDLNKWDPTCDLKDLSADERLEWRRFYTINWLYELVNVFSHIVRQENAPR
ncbi:hypothetical protein KCU67_g5042, partial [Aureobasidium melanogenum]